MCSIDGGHGMLIAMARLNLHEDNRGYRSIVLALHLRLSVTAVARMSVSTKVARQRKLLELRASAANFGSGTSMLSVSGHRAGA